MRSVRARLRDASLLDLLGASLSLLALVWFVRRGLTRPMNPYDEGIILGNADALRHGRVLYRDVYANYPPGTFLLMARLLDVFGSSVLVARLFGGVVHALLAAITGRLAGRVAGRRVSLFASGLSAVWLVRLLAIPLAWLLALTCALAAVELALTFRGAWSSRRAALLGAVIGLVGCFRHDLFLYSGVSLVAVWSVGSIAARRRLVPKPTGVYARLLGIGALVTVGVLALVWAPTLVRAGLSAPLHDLYLDQVRHVLPGRNLPVPSPFGLLTDVSGHLSLPGFLVDTGRAGVLLAVVAPVVAAAALVRVVRRRGSGDELVEWVAPVVGLLVVALACLPQLLQRADGTHSLFALTPGLALAAGAVERRTRAVRELPAAQRSRVTVLVAVLLPVLLVSPAQQELQWSLGRTWYHSAAMGGRFGPLVQELDVARRDARLAAVRFLRGHAGPGEMVFSGCTQHRRVWANELDLYFLADRRSGTKYAQFDPGIQDSLAVQRRIAADLDRHRVRAVVLATCERVEEPNASAERGSGWLDAWLAREFRVVGGGRGYRFLLRDRPPAGAASTAA